MCLRPSAHSQSTAISASPSGCSVMVCKFSKYIEFLCSVYSQTGNSASPLSAFTFVMHIHIDKVNILVRNLKKVMFSISSLTYTQESSHIMTFHCLLQSHKKKTNKQQKQLNCVVSLTQLLIFPSTSSHLPHPADVEAKDILTQHTHKQGRELQGKRSAHRKRLGRKSTILI